MPPPSSSSFSHSMENLYRGLPCGRFILKLASTAEERTNIFKLRFNIFNEELGEGLQKNEATGLDVDEFDECCDHLMLLVGEKVVGTYRLLFGPSRPTQGFYTETEFNLKGLNINFNLAVELGRGCIDKEHRKQTTLMALFWGLHRYMEARGARYLLGCGSLSSRNANDAEATFAALLDSGKVDLNTHAEPHPPNQFQGDAHLGQASIPPLIQFYLEFGARILGRPAYDPHFRCYDLLVLMDTEQLSVWGQELLSRFDKRLESAT